MFSYIQARNQDFTLGGDYRSYEGALFSQKKMTTFFRRPQNAVGSIYLNYWRPTEHNISDF